MNYTTKMACLLLSSTCEEQQSVGLVQFLWAKGHNPSEIHRDMCGVFGEDCMDRDHLFGIVVSTSDCHPRGPGFDSRLYSRNFSGSIGSGTGSTQPREDNLVATMQRKNIDLDQAYFLVGKFKTSHDFWISDFRKIGSVILG